MLLLSLLVFALVGWLLWEWKTGALTPPVSGADRDTDRPRAVAGRRIARSGGRLPTAARLGVDADAASRFGG